MRSKRGEMVMSVSEKTKTNSLIEYFYHDPIFSYCSTHDLSRLVPGTIEKHFTKNECIFRAGEDAQYLFMIVSGSITLLMDDQPIHELTSGLIGVEVGLDEERYLGNAVANDPTTVLQIPKELLKIVMNREPRLKTSFLHSLFNLYSKQKIKEQQHDYFFNISEDDEEEALEQEVISKWKTFGWLLTIIVPISVFFIGNQFHFNWNMNMFLVLFSSALVMWMFRLAAEFIPALLVMIGVLLIGIAPASVALNGFASDTYFMALSVFGLSTVLVSSGLTYRIILLLLNIFPKSRFWYGLSLFLTGSLLTPVIPSTFGRISISSHLYHDMSETIHYKDKGKASTHLAASAFSGFSLLDHIFLSTGPITFAIFALLPDQVQKDFHWIAWFGAAFVTGFSLVVMYVLYVTIIFRNHETPALTKENVVEQIKFLGPIKMKEWAAIIGIILFLIGVTTMDYHHIDASFLGLAILYLFLALGVLGKEDFQKKIDWTFMIFLGSLIGLENVMNYVGLEHWMATELEWLGYYMRDNFPLFVLLLAGAIFVARFFLQNAPTALIFASIFLPLAEQTGTNPWVVVFVILILSEAWFFPYQSEYYSLFLEETEKCKTYDQKSFYTFNLGINLIRLLAVFLSIPYWMCLDIL